MSAPTKKIVPDRKLIAVNWQADERFALWFKAEKERRGMTARGLLNALAVSYVLTHQDASSWDEK